ncbi:MAG TPA: hypothetical protein VLI06_11835 [Solimonas sp.]|nr:hypothetical protein [Solimonas sp.]
MDPAYLTWLWILAGGMLAGFFVRPKAILLLAAALFAVAVGGLILSSVFGQETFTWVFGIAAMAIPLLGVLAAAGATLGAALRRRMRRDQ